MPPVPATPLTSASSRLPVPQPPQSLASPVTTAAVQVSVPTAPTQIVSVPSLTPTQVVSAPPPTPTQMLMVGTLTPDGLDQFTPPPSRVPPSNLSTSQAQDGWRPTHNPSWTLGPQHRSYVHAASSYLTGVPGGPEWERLLASYIDFEGLSSVRSVSVPDYHTSPPLTVQ